MPCNRLSHRPMPCAINHQPQAEQPTAARRNAPMGGARFRSAAARRFRLPVVLALLVMLVGLPALRAFMPDGLAGQTAAHASGSAMLGDSQGPMTWEEFEAQQGRVHEQEEQSVDEAANNERAPAPVGVGQVGWLALERPLAEAPPPFEFGPMDVTQPAPNSLRATLARMRHVAQSDRHRGLVLFLDGAPLPLSQVWELSEAIQEVRKAGRQVAVFAESFTLGGYLLAASADRVLLQRGGMIELAGPAVEEMYLLGLFEKLGVKADLLQKGDFKGAAEPFTQRQPSEAWNQMFDALLDDLYIQIVGHIATHRKLDREQVEHLLAEGFAMSDQELVKAGLVDQLVSRDLEEATGEMFGADFAWDRTMGAAGRSARMDNPFAALSMLMQGARERPLRRPTIGVLHVNGAIQSGDGGQGMLGGQAAGSRTILRAAATMRDEPRIGGVIVRIESPGGSALASEVIWQAVRDLAQHKPVFVSIGGMAASGGYYIAVAGERIYVSPSSLLGSIGVVGGKFVLGDLYQKLGINVHRRSRGPLGDPFNSVEPFTDAQREVVERAFGRIYDQFLDRVKQGRGQRIKDLDAVVGGRVFTGRQAVENGLADRVGGMQTAINDMADRLNFEPGRFDVVEYPRPMALAEYLETMFGVRSGPLPAAGAPFGPQAHERLLAVRAVLGERTWLTIRPHLEGLMLMRSEPALLLMPWALNMP